MGIVVSHLSYLLLSPFSKIGVGFPPLLLTYVVMFAVNLARSNMGSISYIEL